MATGKIRTKYFNLYRDGRVVHKVTARSDWKLSDWKDLSERFPRTYAKSARYTRIPTHLLGHGDFSFAHIYRMKMAPDF